MSLNSVSPLPRTKTGTHEWADETRNLFIGCRHDCRYCFARANALRFGLIKSVEQWKEMRLNKRVESDLTRKKPVRLFEQPRRIMVPSTHDIFENHLDIVTPFLTSLLADKHMLLIVTKPRHEVVKHLCAELQKYRGQIVFRFTIGSMSNEILSFWEPGAPSYDERYESLWTAYASGFETSVSCEPYLDDQIVNLVMAVSSLVTDSIWIGKMNRISNRVNTDGWSSKERSFLHRVFDAQTNEFIKDDLYGRLKDKPQVRWKDSIKKVLGLPEEEIG